MVSFDWSDAEKRFAHEPADPGLTPKRAFDRNWARGLIESTLAALCAEYEKRGQSALFAELAPLVWGQSAAAAVPETLAAPAARAGLNTHAFTVALQRVRKRLAERLRAAVAETFAAGADIDAVLRHLIAAVRGFGVRRLDAAFDGPA